MLENYEQNDRGLIGNLFNRIFGRTETEPPAPPVGDIQLGKRSFPALIEKRANGSFKVTPANPTRDASATTGVKNLSKRVSMANPDNYSFMNSLAVFAPSSRWRQYALKENISLADLQKIPIDDIAELLADVSPEVSNALHIRTILSNAGYEIEARKMDSEEIDERANAELKNMRACLARIYGTEDVIYNQAFTTLWIRGGILMELVLEDNLKDFADIALPDPKTLKFKKVVDPVRGQVWDFGQMQNGKFVSFRNSEQISYIPFMPFPNQREGRPIISSSFFIAIFTMAVLRDFKRVIQQQGYPRYDIEIDLEQMKGLMPSDAENDPQKFEDWADEIVSKITSYIENLEPDETFVHFSGITVNQPVGAMGTNSLSSIDGLFKGLERMAARACKVPPLFMGIIENVSEANANRQFEAFLNDLQSGQHIVENGFARLFELGLLAKGMMAKVYFRFAKSRESERIRDAQAALLEMQGASFAYKMGWISQDEAAKRGVGVDEADQPEPREMQDVIGASIGVANGDGGVNRGIGSGQRMPTPADLKNAQTIFEKFAPAAAAELIVAEAADVGNAEN